MTYIPKDGHRRWAEGSTTHQGAPGLPGAPRWVVPTCWAPSGTYWLELIYSIKNPPKVSAHLELCRIGGLM